MNEANVTFFIYFVSVIQSSNRRHFITSNAFYQIITILAIKVQERRSIIKRVQNNQEFRRIFCLLLLFGFLGKEKDRKPLRFSVLVRVTRFERAASCSQMVKNT
jgi:hypothetical protein